MSIVPLPALRHTDFGTHEHEYDDRDVALYALGVGAVLILLMHEP